VRAPRPALPRAARRRAALTLTRAKVLFALAGVAEATILPFFPLLLLDRGLPASEIGLVLSAMALAGLVATPLWGLAADRRLGGEKTVVAAAGSAALLAVLLARADDTTAFVAAAIFFSAARAPLQPLADAIALDRVRSSERGDYARMRVWMSVGWAVAVVAWGAMLQADRLSLAPYLYAATVAAVAVWAAFAMRRTRVSHRVRESQVGGAASVLPRLLALLVSLLLVYAAFAATFNFLALRIQGLGGGAFLVGVAASLQAVAEVPVMLATPRLTRAIGHAALYALGCAFFAAVFLSWAVLTDPVAISILKLVAGVGFALTYVGSVVLVDDLVPRRLRATGQGFAKAVAFGLAPVAGTAAGGVVYGYLGPRELFLVSAAAALAGGLITWLAVPAGHGRAELEP
jgi:PPP family 3-phenylpropionic acid transporter